MTSPKKIQAWRMADRIKENGIGQLTPEQSNDPTFLTYMGQELGAGTYVSFWHVNAHVFVTHEWIAKQLRA